MSCTNENCLRLLDAAVGLLEARSNQMVTVVEWDALRLAITACGGSVPTAEDQQV